MFAPCSDEYCESISKFTEQVIGTHGYSFEKHNVYTEDDYILSLYRIISSPNTKDTTKKSAVLVVHGFASSVAESVLEKNHLGYYLTDNGFDVWIANCRGNTFSRGHRKYHHIKDKNNYWNFSFDDIAQYDLPALIDFILNVTATQTLFYIGISQGATAFMSLMSIRQNYNEKIKLACLMCPAMMYTENANTWPLKYVFCYLIPYMERTVKWLGFSLHETPGTHLIRWIGSSLAKPHSLGEIVCDRMFDLLAGHRNPDKKANMDFSKVCVTTPNTSSWKQLLHFSQIIMENRFARYDYGPTNNQKLYNSEKPPLYDISKVTSPVALFYSGNDMYYGEQDIELLAKNMGNMRQLLLEQKRIKTE